MRKYIVATAVALVVAVSAWKLKPAKAPGPAVVEAALAVPASPVLPAPRAAVPVVRKTVAAKAVTPLEDTVKLSKSVLPSKKEKEDLQAGLRSPILIGEARSRLLDISDHARKDEAQKERMRAIDFLDAALMWKENPSREQALKAVLDVVNRQVNDLEVSKELKQSLAGDVVELYGVLLQVDTDRAQDAFAHAIPEQQRAFLLAQSMLPNLNAKGKVE